jgi:ribosomal protein S18 acetylase RimI-like enzyme
MLVACDAAARQKDHQCIWLHVRQSDAAAQQLYAGYGYQEQDRDKPKIGLFGLGGGSSKTTARILMKCKCFVAT